MLKKTASDESEWTSPLLDAQPPQVQGAFQCLLATAMHEASKFELLNVRAIAFATKSAPKWETLPEKWKNLCEDSHLVGCRSDKSAIRGPDVGAIIQMRLPYVECCRG